MAETELKPCPFCGGRGVLRKKSKTIVHGETTHTAYVECSQCHARGSRWLLDEAETPTIARNTAVKAWNRRADNDTNTL